VVYAVYEKAQEGKGLRLAPTAACAGSPSRSMPEGSEVKPEVETAILGSLPESRFSV